MRAEIDGCAVGRDNPTHRRLVTGELTAGELGVWARQQWLWHQAFPGILEILAARCPVPEFKTSLTRRAALEAGAIPAEGPGRCAEWAAVALALGIDGDELAAAVPTPETETMIAVQREVAARPFPVGWVGIMVGVDGETQSHNGARRRALRDRYGVPEAALAYVRVPAADPVEAIVGEIHPHVDGSLAGMREAVRLVLRARWQYFNGIGRAAC
ncbi:MAG TPA: hypothetical protein VG186_17930 [Solirubrobacteraceae bacterium]|jgi:pyrroloquinoline quinone (PQQ) biosynthesis protein C|nr:hypothetical protein [Solirubrobacteraceae bacterium]